MPWLHGLPGDTAGPGAPRQPFDSTTTVQNETSDNRGHSGGLAATFCGVVFLLLFGPLVILVVERICFGTDRFDDALRAVGIDDFYSWFYRVTGIAAFVYYLLRAFNLNP